MRKQDREVLISPYELASTQSLTMSYSVLRYHSVVMKNSTHDLMAPVGAGAGGREWVHV